MSGVGDGGIWALGGYLYQTIGVLGIGAFLTNQGEDPLIPESDLDLLIQVVDVNQINALRIQPETLNNDALITCGLRPTDSGVFVQFKYSSQIPAPTIGPADVDQIIGNFDDSVARARAAGINISACVLITNRRFAQGPGSGGERWQEERNNRIGNYEIREIVEISPDVFTQELIDYAKRRGVLEQELEAGIRRLVGEIIIQSVDRELFPNSFMETLNESFTNFTRTRPIAHEDLSGRCERDLRNYGANVLGLDHWDFNPVLRKSFDDLATQINRRALVAVYGPGGCGKSVLQWQFLWSKIGHGICKIESASNITDNWLQVLVNHEWRNLPIDICPNDHDEITIRRVIIANSDNPKPIFWLGLDGLDEDTTLPVERRAKITHLIKIFRGYDLEVQRSGGPSEAVLILTCREKNLLRDWLEIPPDREAQFPPTISLGDFDKDELRRGFKKKFPERIDFEPLPSYARSNALFGDLSESEDGQIRGNQTIIVALQHPGIWRALLNLPNHVQEDVLDGHPQALAYLANNILEWFNYKIRRRKSEIGLPNDVAPILANIASNTDANNIFPMGVWLDLAHNYGEILARTLYYEAANGGLIDLGSSQSWRWRHSFIYMYLAGLHE